VTVARGLVELSLAVVGMQFEVGPEAGSMLVARGDSKAGFAAWLEVVDWS